MRFHLLKVPFVYRRLYAKVALLLIDEGMILRFLDALAVNLQVDLLYIVGNAILGACSRLRAKIRRIQETELNEIRIVCLHC